MKVAVCGCVHGFLNTVYQAIHAHDNASNTTTDLLVCCGDFQAIRHQNDIPHVSCPPKYRGLKDFVQYADGTKRAPFLTVFIGGNHEVVSLAQQLHYGGWVAENIFYIGHSGVIRVGWPNATTRCDTLRIAGISGIYKPYSYYCGYYEKPPFDPASLKSFCHMRCQDIEKLKLIKEPVDIFLSHDWPQGLVISLFHEPLESTGCVDTLLSVSIHCAHPPYVVSICIQIGDGIEQHGNWKDLIRRKPFFEQEIYRNCLGNPHTAKLLEHMKPRFWFAAHLHTRFDATVDHGNHKTQFLALDKPSPGKRQFIEFFTLDPNSHNLQPYGVTSNELKHTPNNQHQPGHVQASTTDTPLQPQIYYDTEWLSILCHNNDRLVVGRHPIPPSDPSLSKVEYPPPHTFQTMETNLQKYSHSLHHNADLYPWEPWNPTTNPSVQRMQFLKLIGAPFDILDQRLHDMSTHHTMQNPNHTHKRCPVFFNSPLQQVYLSPTPSTEPPSQKRFHSEEATSSPQPLDTEELDIDNF